MASHLVDVCAQTIQEVVDVKRDLMVIETMNYVLIIKY